MASNQIEAPNFFSCLAEYDPDDPDGSDDTSLVFGKPQSVILSHKPPLYPTSTLPKFQTSLPSPQSASIYQTAILPRSNSHQASSPSTVIAPISPSTTPPEGSLLPVGETK